MVLIDMDMPKCCKDCIFWNYYEGNCREIKVSEWKDFDIDEEYEKRAYNCPLKSVDDYNSIFDAIKAEIEEQVLESLSDGGDDWFTAEKVNECLDIIDKYKAESGDKENNSN